MRLERCIPRIRKDDGGVDLFFPDRSANLGNIECWSPIGEHCEASIGYFRERTRAPRTAEETKRAGMTGGSYARFYGCSIRFVKRYARRPKP